MNKPLISMSIGAIGSPSFPEPEVIREVANAGFDRIDYRMTDPALIFDQDTFRPYLIQLAETANQCGIGIHQVHGPYLPFFNKAPDPESLFDAQLLALQNAEEAGIPFMVFHPCVFTWCLQDIGREEAAERNFQWFSRFIPFLQNSRIKLCIENCYYDFWYDDSTPSTFGSCASELIRITDEVNRLAGMEVLGVCFDSGHAHCSGADEVAMAAALGKRIWTLHLHDNDSSNDHHFLPHTIENGVRWEELMQTLTRTGYAGTLNFELDNHLMTRSRELTRSVLALICEAGSYLRTLM